MTNVGRTWDLWAHQYNDGTFRHIGPQRWVKLHLLTDPIVPVQVEEILGDPHAPEVTHYGWEAGESKYPTMIQLRAGINPTDPRRDFMLLDMCFAYGMAVEIKHGKGNFVALRITSRPTTVVSTL